MSPLLPREGQSRAREWHLISPWVALQRADHPPHASRDRGRACAGSVQLNGYWYDSITLRQARRRDGTVGRGHRGSLRAALAAWRPYRPPTYRSHTPIARPSTPPKQSLSRARAASEQRQSSAKPPPEHRQSTTRAQRRRPDEPILPRTTACRLAFALLHAKSSHNEPGRRA